MTGTPVENSVHDLWSIFEFLNPGFLGSFALLKGVLKNEKASSGLVGVLSKVVKPFVLRRTKENVLKDLPSKTEQVLYCYMDKVQRARYDEVKEYYRHHIAEKVSESGSEKAKIHVLEALLRLRQIACDPSILSSESASEGVMSIFSSEKSVVPSAKLDMLLEQIEELSSTNHKALVFSQFTSVLKSIALRLETRGIEFEYLDGQTRNRKAVIDNFQSDNKKKVFLLSLKAGGVGLNLTAADYCYLVDPWWNPAAEKQAIDRAHRLGQKNAVMAYKMITKDTVEEKIHKLQREKQDLAGQLIDNSGAIASSCSVDELLDLF